jgi:Cytochrome P460
VIRSLTAFPRGRGVSLGLAGAAIATLLAISEWHGLASAAAQTSKTASSSQAAFDPDGSARLPVGYEKWEHIGEASTPIDKAVLDGTDIVTLKGAYVEPSAFAYFEKTGQWRDGTTIVNEFSVIKTGKKGIGLMVKSSERFPGAPGNWSYYAFLPIGSNFPSTASARPRQQCEACHVKLGAKTDYVVTD